MCSGQPDSRKLDAASVAGCSSARGSPGRRPRVPPRAAELRRSPELAGRFCRLLLLALVFLGTPSSLGVSLRMMGGVRVLGRHVAAHTTHPFVIAVTSVIPHEPDAWVEHGFSLPSGRFAVRYDQVMRHMAPSCRPLVDQGANVYGLR